MAVAVCVGVDSSAPTLWLMPFHTPHYGGSADSSVSKGDGQCHSEIYVAAPPCTHAASTQLPPKQPLPLSPGHLRSSSVCASYPHIIMSGARSNSRNCGSGSSGRSGLLKAALGALAMASAATASIHPGAASSMASRPAPATPTNNRWVSRALAARGGADEPSETPEGIPGVLSEVEIALSSFNDIVGENLLVVDNPKKGTTKEVSPTLKAPGGEGVFIVRIRMVIGSRVVFRVRHADSVCCLFSPLLQHALENESWGSLYPTCHPSHETPVWFSRVWEQAILILDVPAPP